MSEQYITGTNQHITVHSAEDCRGPFCVIHNPSNHFMREFKTHWRNDRMLMERICPHGVGHPDPDHLAFLPASKRQMESIHGCDGCCHD